MTGLDWAALALTARLAASASLVLLVVGLPLAWWLASTRWRGRVVVETVTALPLVLPPTVLGFYLLLFFGPQGALGPVWHRVAGSALPFSFGGLLLASVLYSLPFVVQPFTAGFRAVEPVLVEAARNLGASRWRAWWRVAVPLAWPGIVSGVVLSFAHTLGEFGVALMVGGNIAGQTRTVSMVIYDDVQALDYRRAALHAGVLLGFSFVVLVSTYVLQGRRLRPVGR